MRTKRRTAAIVAAWTTVGVMGAAALTGVAMAADGSSSPAPTSTSSASTAAGSAGAGLGRIGQLRRLGSKVLHGEFVVQAKGGDKTVDTQLGVISAVTDTSVAVKSSDGYTQTWTLTPNTRVRADKKPGTAADLKVGTTVRLLGVKAADGADVVLAVVRPA